MMNIKYLHEKKEYVNRFTVQFFERSLKVGDKVLSLGQVCTDFLNVDEAMLGKMNKEMIISMDFFTKEIFIPDAKIDKAFALSVRNEVAKLNELISTLPLYEHLNIRYSPMDETHVTETVLEELKEMLEAGTVKNHLFTTLLLDCATIPDDIIAFKQIVVAITDFYLDILKKRTAENYAISIYDFFNDEMMQAVLDNVLPPAFQARQEQPVNIEYVTMPVPGQPEKYCIAERIEFDNILSFLYVEFFRSLTNGRAPRRCQNCGTYFLLESGYNVKYCNNIAPNETKRTCRAVGAHKKEKEKREKSPVEAEYKRAYERLKKRKDLGKISIGKWNEMVADIQGVRDQVVKGEMDEFEGIGVLKEI